MLRVFRSNRAENLIDAFARSVAEPLARWTDPEIIVVQSLGMETWLSQQLARRFGVFANAQFPFPRAFIQKAFGMVLGDAAAGNRAFEPENLVFAVMSEIPRHLGDPRFAAIASYLEGDDRGIRLNQLAGRIAWVFDQYLVYRPELVLRFENAGVAADWQAELWNSLVGRFGRTHFTANAREFLLAMHAGGGAGRLPHRVSIFGVSSLPPLYVRILAAIARESEVSMFVLSPSAQYWADISGKRATLRESAKAGEDPETVEERLHLDEGHPLLASLGRLGRDFQFVLEECADYDEPDFDMYEDPAASGEPTLLHALQSDILELRRRGVAGVPALSLRPGDDSIEIHSCHGAMREVEVLQDRLRAAFDADPTLEPSDVIVMAPAIEAYAPFIEAVFSPAGERRPDIPFSIADRSVAAGAPVIEALDAILGCVRSRLTLSQVLDLLSRAPVHAKFSMTQDDVETVSRWATEAGARWGADAEHRASVAGAGLKFGENTWRFALDRLLIGFALPANGRFLFEGVLPFDDVEGKEAALLGRFALFCDELFSVAKELAQPLPVQSWAAAIAAAMDALMACEGDDAAHRRMVIEAVSGMASAAADSGFDGTVDVKVVRSVLSSRFGDSMTVHGFLNGGVTFCNLLPMRSIPFRIVCLMGMSDSDFPRPGKALAFDEVAARPKAGDRSARNDDRYMFLESLLSARDRLIVLYRGQAAQDNARLPPSVVISDLMDAVAEGFVPESFERGRTGAKGQDDVRDAVEERLVTRHSLQPFSPRCFDPRRPLRMSCSADFCEGAAVLVSGEASEKPFVTRALAPVEALEKPSISLDDLCLFLRNPSKHFLQRRLGIELEKPREEQEQREPVELGGLESFLVRETLLDAALVGRSSDSVLPLLAAAGVLPPGTPGKAAFSHLDAQARAVAAGMLGLTGGAAPATLDFDMDLGPARVFGVIDHIYKAGRIVGAAGKANVGRITDLWVRHLALLARGAGGIAAASALVAREDGADAGCAIVRLGALALDFRGLLAELVDIYLKSMNAPLPLFPEASFAYAQALSSPGQDDYDARTRAMWKAVAAWDPSWTLDGAVPEKDDPWVSLCFRGTDPLRVKPPWCGRGFEELAQAVFCPIIDAMDGTGEEAAR